MFNSFNLPWYRKRYKIYSSPSCTIESASAHLPSSASLSTLAGRSGSSSFGAWRDSIPTPSVWAAIAIAESRTKDSARSHCPPDAHASSAARQVAGDGSCFPLAHIASIVARAVSAVIVAVATVRKLPPLLFTSLRSPLYPGGSVGNFPYRGGDCEGGGSLSSAPGIP